MNAGAEKASGDVFWFLHADSIIYENAINNIQFYLNEKNKDWGRFNVKLSGSHFMFRVIEKMINLRSCLSSIATGDQGIFVKRTIFEQVGGYPAQPLMEDIELSKKLKKISPSACVKHAIITSSRRWEQKGILTTVLLMWRLRFLYWLGVSADKLASQYR
jgi:rSAM/selenodomain-associated transferase 2